MMKRLGFLTISLLFPYWVYALDVGNGSLGACTQASFTNNNSGPYNCASLTVNANFNFIGDGGTTAPVVIKVTGNVVINNTLSVNGASGTVGKDDDGGGGNQVSGGIPGRGGFAGGNTGIDATFAAEDAISGGYTGYGRGGQFGLASLAMGWASGGGGGGGSFGNNGIAGNNGDTDGSGGTTAGAGGNAGTIYATTSGFKTLFIGGSGGGGGGPSADSADQADMGGSGGGGGGAIRIMAGGDITVVGAIQANGGNGGNGFQYSGGGGGGSGGAIFLEALGDVIISGSLSALGGTGGAGAPTVGTTVSDGGNGGVGRIRIDDSDGNWTGGGTVSPAAYEAVVDSDSSGVTRIDSNISCGSVELIGDNDHYFHNLFIGFALVGFVVFGFNFAGRKIKIDIRR